MKENNFVKFFFIPILRIGALMLLIAACQNSYSPKAAAEKFLDAFSEKKFDEAKKYCTPETVKLVEIAESLTKLSSAKTDFTGKKYEVVSQDVRGDNAKVKFKEKGSEEIQTMTLKYSGNQWLVSISKEEVMSKENTGEDIDSRNDSLKTK